MTNNKKIVDEFTKLVKQIQNDIDISHSKKEEIKHSFRLKQIKKVLEIIKSYPNKITKGSDLKDIKGVGANSQKRIDEILSKGKLSEIKNNLTKYKIYI